MALSLKYLVIKIEKKTQTVVLFDYQICLTCIRRVVVRLLQPVSLFG